MRYFLQRLLQFVIVFFLVTFGVMVFMRIGMNKPGDPARTMLGGVVSDEKAAAVNAQYHLNDNLFVQYFFWLGKMFRGDFGISVQQNVTVANYMKGRVLVTFFLGFYSILWALIIAVPVAVYQAYKRDSNFDRAGNLFSFLFVSLPALVLAPFIIFVFVDKLGWFPRISEKVMPWDDPRRPLPELLPAGRWCSPFRWRPSSPGCCAPTWCKRCRVTSSRWPAPRACHPVACCGIMHCATRCSRC